MIICSNCGRVKRCGRSIRGVVRAVNEGWRSVGSALYCGDCVRTWKDRNGKPFPEKKGYTYGEAIIQIATKTGVTK